MKKIISALMIAVCIGMAMPAQAQLIKFGCERWCKPGKS